MTDVHDTDDLQPGMAVGPYDLIAPIGIGGMARVWAARVRGQTDVVALKMLLQELAENVEVRKMFLDEARIASRVRHPNVCTTFELGEHHGLLYLAMELLDGPSLMRMLRPGIADISDCDRVPIRPRIAARIVADACAGLHVAHELVGDDGRPLAVVHRDVTPHNLLMTTAGAVKVTDFGIAKALGKSHMTVAGQLKGKLAYMAPEQLVGGSIDRRCDVFALGCVLYEITTGQRPFQGDHDPQVMTAIITGRYEPPAAIVQGYPHQLSIIVMRALANEPDNRYPSAEHMRQALEGYLQGTGPSVTQAQIAALVSERCGVETTARKALVHNEPAPPAPEPGPGARTPPKQTPRSESDSGAMMMEGRPTPRRGVLGIVLSALVGAALGLGVLSYIRTVKKPRTAAVALDATAPSTASATVAIAPPPPPTPTTPTIELDPSAGTAAPPPGQRRVRLRITPSAAILLVDGVVLPRGTDTIAKPEDGSTMNVLVRADKYEDTIVLVDSATPEEVEVALVPKSRYAGGLGAQAPTIASPPQAGATGSTAAPSAATTSARPRTPKDSGAPVMDAPPNPYD